MVLDWDSDQPAYLGDVLAEHDWSGAPDRLPSHDEEFEDDLDEELIYAAA